MLIQVSTYLDGTVLYFESSSFRVIDYLDILHSFLLLSSPFILFSLERRTDSLEFCLKLAFLLSCRIVPFPCDHLCPYLQLNLGFWLSSSFFATERWLLRGCLRRSLTRQL
jgi:hypothetical protein